MTMEPSKDVIKASGDGYDAADKARDLAIKALRDLLLAEQYSQGKKQALHEWANSVTSVIASHAGGLDVSAFWHVRRVIHDVRKAVLADDYTHFMTDEKHQADLFDLSEAAE